MGYEFSSTTLRSDANLKAYYKLEDANDELATYNLSNAGTTPFASALYNNGSNHGSSNTTKYLHISNNLGITGGAITIIGWAKLADTTSFQAIAMQGCGSTQYVNFFIYYDGNNSLGFGSGYVVANRQKQLVANNCVYASQSPGTSEFHHYALTYNGTTLSLYYDGGSIGTPTDYSGNGAGVASDYFAIGFNNGQSGNAYLSGMADDFEVFNRALSSAEVLAIYNGSAPIVATTNYLNQRGRNRLKFGGVSLG